MQKIPTLFERDAKFLVMDIWRADCTWVRDGQGVATEKVDGTNVRLTIRSGTVVRVEKRRNPSKQQKAAGIVDAWYTDALTSDPADAHIYAAVALTDCTTWVDGEHSCEAIGPNIQGNPLGLANPVCIPFNNLDRVWHSDAPRTFDGLYAILATQDSRLSPGHLAEGIVFHHPDGRRAKIKRKDFGL